MSDVTAPPRSYHDRDEGALAALGDRLLRAAGRGRVLLRGATVLTMDPQIGDLAAGDVLLNGAVIEAVGPDLAAQVADPDLVILDLPGMIVLPGLVDGHRHCWQNQLRRLICDAEIDEYIAMTHGASPCTTGRPTCSPGTWSACSGPSTPG